MFFISLDIDADEATFDEVEALEEEFLCSDIMVRESLPIRVGVSRSIYPHLVVFWLDFIFAKFLFLFRFFIFYFSIVELVMCSMLEIINYRWKKV